MIFQGELCHSDCREVNRGGGFNLARATLCGRRYVLSHTLYVKYHRGIVDKAVWWELLLGFW